MFSSSCNAVVNECDGEYKLETRKRLLEWNIAVLDTSNSSGALEFSVASNCTPSDFFPLHVSFASKNPYADLRV